MRCRYSLVQLAIQDAFFVPTRLVSAFGDIPHDPVDAYRHGNPFGYYFNPRFANRRMRRKQLPDELPAQVYADWVHRGRIGPLSKSQRHELRRDVLGNLTKIGQDFLGKTTEMKTIMRVGIADAEAESPPKHKAKST